MITHKVIFISSFLFIIAVVYLVIFVNSKKTNQSTTMNSLQTSAPTRPGSGYTGPPPKLSDGTWETDGKSFSFIVSDSGMKASFKDLLKTQTQSNDFWSFADSYFLIYNGTAIYNGNSVHSYAYASSTKPSRQLLRTAYVTELEGPSKIMLTWRQTETQRETGALFGGPDPYSLQDIAENIILTRKSK